MYYVEIALSFVHLIVSMYTKQKPFTDEEFKEAENLIHRIDCFLDEIFLNHDDEED